MRRFVSWHNWRGFLGLLRHAVDPLSVIQRYYMRRGAYPVRLKLRTPIGPLLLDLYSRDDLITVHEIFFREDYHLREQSAERMKVVIDFGANIGIASAYFLTRNSSVRVHCYEPVPENILRAQKNLAPFAERSEFNECAVGVEDGAVCFGIEPTGRYGGIGQTGTSQIEVPCRRGDNELRRILQRHGHIDLVKIDIEEMEIPLIKTLGKDVLDHIDCIVAECNGEALALADFGYSQYLSIARFDHRPGQRQQAGSETAECPA